MSEAVNSAAKKLKVSVMHFGPANVFAENKSSVLMMYLEEQRLSLEGKIPSRDFRIPKLLIYYLARSHTIGIYCLFNLSNINLL